MKKKNLPSASKGHTGEMLRFWAASAIKPLHVKLKGSVAQIKDDDSTYIAVTVRGSSHCRRKQARQLQTWLREQQGDAQ